MRLAYDEIHDHGTRHAPPRARRRPGHGAGAGGMFSRPGVGARSCSRAGRSPGERERGRRGGSGPRCSAGSRPRTTRCRRSARSASRRAFLGEREWSLAGTAVELAVCAVDGERAVVRCGTIGNYVGHPLDDPYRRDVEAMLTTAEHTDEVTDVLLLPDQYADLRPSRRWTRAMGTTTSRRASRSPVSGSEPARTAASGSLLRKNDAGRHVGRRRLQPGPCRGFPPADGRLRPAGRAGDKAAPAEGPHRNEEDRKSRAVFSYLLQRFPATKPAAHRTNDRPAVGGTQAEQQEHDVPLSDLP